MASEKGLKLRTRLSAAKTLLARTDAETAYSAGEMTVVGDTIGVVVEDAAENSDFVLVYSAEKIVAPKAAGAGFSPGDTVYYDAAARNVTDESTGNTKCGRALAAAESADTEALIDLMVLA